jgi:hypothetical protein
MNTKRKRKYNERRLFFNSDKPHCKICGSKLVEVTNLLGEVKGQTCPLAYAKSHQETAQTLTVN